MTDMTPQKAKDIVLAINPIQSESDYIFCKGFLTGIEYEREAAKGLVERCMELFDVLGMSNPALPNSTRERLIALQESLAAYKARTEGKCPKP